MMDIAHRSEDLAPHLHQPSFTMRSINNRESGEFQYSLLERERYHHRTYIVAPLQSIGRPDNIFTME